ncbi:MAG: DoxX family protein [Burkholderiales bacterium]|nr:DoxX family protein [Burkholderiales bacterium]
MIDTRTAPYGLFLLRVALGVMFIAHALLKYVVFTMPGFAGFLGQIGYPAALAWPIFLAELFGGIALVLGVWSRAVAFVLTPVLVGAFLVHAGNGWLFTNANGGWEYPLFLVVAGLAIVLGGDGAFALRPTHVPGVAPAALSARTA